VTLFYFLASRENRQIIRHNIEEVFAESCAKEEIDFIFRQTLRGILDHYFEKLYLAFSTDRQWKDYLLDRIRISGRKNLDALLAGRKGLILVTAHFGGVEFLPAYLTLLGYPIAIIARFKTERLKQRCEKKARSVGAVIIDSNEKGSFFLALSALREGRILITQCDEAVCWKADPGKATALFGTSFRVDRTPTILQKRSGAPILFGYVRREGRGCYAAVIEDLRAADGRLPERMGPAVLKRLEELVYTYPDQWYIWKDFHLMKMPGAGDIAVEDRECPSLCVKPPAVASLQSSRTFPQTYRQYRRQTSV
jgi:lauroyl/myristoyl acyltransferase